MWHVEVAIFIIGFYAGFMSLFLWQNWNEDPPEFNPGIGGF